MRRKAPTGSSSRRPAPISKVPLHVLTKHVMRHLNHRSAAQWSQVSKAVWNDARHAMAARLGEEIASLTKAVYPVAKKAHGKRNFTDILHKAVNNLTRERFTIEYEYYSEGGLYDTALYEATLLSPHFEVDIYSQIDPGWGIHHKTRISIAQRLSKPSFQEIEIVLADSRPPKVADVFKTFPTHLTQAVKRAVKAIESNANSRTSNANSRTSNDTQRRPVIANVPLIPGRWPPYEVLRGGSSRSLANTVRHAARHPAVMRV